MSENGAASARRAGTAREAIRRGAGPPAGAGPLRRLLRRTVLRLLRPYTAQQRMIDERILDAIDELERRAGERDQLELDLLVEDIVSSLDSLRSRIAVG